ncbi:hypothetical protein ASPU41_07290 [Arthrobacter sp. U41]|nr:hypothetical protein ASPU41_07290 [Arthrobacter sp. U41]
MESFNQQVGAEGARTGGWPGALGAVPEGPGGGADGKCGGILVGDTGVSACSTGLSPFFPLK